MAFLSDIKAKLSLDISPFERGLRSAATSTGSTLGKIGKDIGGIGKASGALAVALGLNMQGIADKIARVWTGFSKESQDALEAAVEASDKAADAAEKRLKSAQDKAKENQKKAEDEAKRVANAKANLAKTEREITISQLDDAGKLAFYEQDIFDAMRDKVNAQKESAEYYDAEARRLEAYEAIRLINRGKEEQVEKELTEFFKEIDDYAGRDAKAQEEKTKELEAQSKELEAQKKTIEQTLAQQSNASKKGLLPTASEVASGSRRIGPQARSQAKELDRLQKKQQELSDAEQRAGERITGATSDSERKRAEREAMDIYAERQKVEGRIGKLKGGLEGRVSDIETNKASLKKLEEIEKGIKALNTTLEAKSVQ